MQVRSWSDGQLLTQREKVIQVQTQAVRNGVKQVISVGAMVIMLLNSAIWTLMYLDEEEELYQQREVKVEVW